MGLRKANMGELVMKYAEAKASQLKNAAPEATAECIPTTHATANVPTSKRRPLPAVPQTTSSKPSSPVRPAAPASRAAKGLSNGPVPIASDKENDDNAPQSIDAVPSLKNPKRAKGGGPTSRAASRTAKPTSVLSPRSHNSRTLPRSPVKEYTSPAKPHSYITRPMSPLKPASPLKAAASVATSAISASLHGMVEHAKRGAGATARGLTRTESKEKTTTSKTAKSMAPPPRPVPQPHQQHESTRTISAASSHSNSSNATALSTSTTVVKKGGKAPATMSQTTTEKKGALAAKAVMKKTTTATAAKRVVVAEPAAGRRVLRKRD